MQTILRLPALWAVVCLLAFTACQEDEPNLNPALTISDEMRLGTRLVQAAESAPTDLFPVLARQSNTEVYDYLNSLLAQLTTTPQVTARGSFDWEVILVEDDSRITAVALPGGKMLIYTGLLKALTDEAELVGILAHELYYMNRPVENLARNHSPVLQLLKQQYQNSSLYLLDIAEGNDPSAALEVLLTATTTSYDEATVLEADAFATEVLCPFSYDANGIRDVIVGALEANAIDDIVWFELRHVENLDDRIARLSDLSQGCGTDGAMFANRYQGFVNQLP